MRIQLRFGRDTQLALLEVKKIFYNDENAPVHTGFIINKCYDFIKNDLDVISWVELPAEEVIRNMLKSKLALNEIKTTVNMTNELYDNITKLQIRLQKEFNAKRIHRAFAIKLILYATITMYKKD